MIKVFCSILIAIIAHLAVAVRRSKRTAGKKVTNRDVLVFFILNVLCAALLGTLIHEGLTAIFG